VLRRDFLNQVFSSSLLFSLPPQFVISPESLFSRAFFDVVVFQVGGESVAVDASGRVVARGEDAYVLQYALDNYFSVFIRRGPRPYVVKFRRLVPWWGTYGDHQVGDFAFRVGLEAVGDKMIVSDGAVLRRADGSDVVILYARNYRRFVVAGLVFDGNRARNSRVEVGGRVWPFDGYADFLTGGCVDGGEECFRSGLVMWDVEFRESPGWAFYLGNHAPEELGYRRAAYDRFAFLYNVRAVGSMAGVVFDNVRDSVVFGLFVEGSDGNCVTVMGNPGAELNLHMYSLVLRDCVRRPLSIGGYNDVVGLAVVGGVAGVVVEGLDVESGGLGVGAWGGLTLRGGRVVSRPPEGWNGNVFAWDVEVADVSFTAEVAGDDVGTVLVEDGGVQRRFAFRGVAVRGGGLVYKPRGGSLLVIRDGEFYGLRGLHANLERGGAVELDGVFLDVSDFAVSIGVERYRAYSVTARCARGVFCVGLWGGVGFFSGSVEGGGVAMLLRDVAGVADIALSGSFVGREVGIWAGFSAEGSRAACWGCRVKGGVEGVHVEGNGLFEYCGAALEKVQAVGNARFIERCQ
jgi:hypothetical protein